MFDAIRTSTESFWSFLSDIAIVPLLAAIGCHLLKLACTSRAWRNVLAAAYPETRRGVAADPRRVRLRRRHQRDRPRAGRGRGAHLPRPPRDPGELVHHDRLLDGRPHVRRHGAGPLVFGWALTQGVLPSFDALSALPAFDYSWAFEDGVIHPAALLVYPRRAGGRRLAPAPLLAPAAPPRRTGLQRLRPADPVRPTVVVWQLLDWMLRLLTVWFFLGAFGIPQSVGNVLLVQATMSLSTLVPATPGGIGTEQALLVYAFRDIGVARSTLLAFSVGMSSCSPWSTSSSASRRSSSRSGRSGTGAPSPGRPDAPPPVGPSPSADDQGARTPPPHAALARQASPLRVLAATEHLPAQ